MKGKIQRACILLATALLLSAQSLLAQQEVPEVAQSHFKAGVALIEKAEKPADLLAAMARFEEASLLAPEWPDIRYNLAQLAAETDRPAKAIKEYRAYLSLAPHAADRARVEAEMVRLKEIIFLKRKIGLPGASFVAMPDGIGVLQLYPGSRTGKTGLKRGDKIVAINGQSVAGLNLENFFKAIENVQWQDEPAVAKLSKERMFSRFSGRDKEEKGPVMKLSVITGGDRHLILMKKSMFQSRIIEIEADEFEAEVLKESLPVVVTFWNSGCEPCRQFVPAVEAESARYAGRIKFVNINVDENMNLANELKVKGVPAMMVYRGGTMVSSDMGKLSKDRVEEILKAAVGQ